MYPPPATRIADSANDDEIDSEAVTVRTPNLPPIVVEREEAPFPLVRPVRTGNAPTSTLRLQPLSLRAPASKQHESAWFEKEPPAFVAPGVPEVAETLGASVDALHGYTAPSSRGVGFAMVAMLLAGVVAAGSFFFLSSRTRTDDAKVPDPTSTTQLTNAEAPPTVIAAPTPAPETTTTATPVVETVRTSDLTEVRADRRKVTTPATEPDLRPDETAKSTTDSTVSTPSTPDSTTTPPDIDSKP